MRSQPPPSKWSAKRGGLSEEGGIQVTHQHRRKADTLFYSMGESFHATENLLFCMSNPQTSPSQLWDRQEKPLLHHAGPTARRRQPDGQSFNPVAGGRNRECAELTTEHHHVLPLLQISRSQLLWIIPFSLRKRWNAHSRKWQYHTRLLCLRRHLGLQQPCLACDED
jgi:hypothetical protein